MGFKLVWILTLFKCLSLIEALSIPMCSQIITSNRMRQAITVTDSNNFLRLDEFQRYSKSQLYAVFNENYVVRFNADLTLAWSNKCGNPHSFFGTQLQRLAISMDYVYFLSADSVYIMKTGGAAVSTPGILFSTGYTPLAIAYQSSVVYIVSKDSTNYVIISSFSSTSESFSLISNYLISGVTTYTAIINAAISNSNCLFVGGGNNFNAGIIFWTWTGTPVALTINSYFDFGVSTAIHFDNNSNLKDTFGYHTSSGSYCVARIAVTTSTISIHRCFIGYIVTGISEFVFVYAFAKTAVIKFDILLYSYVTFTLPSATSYNVPSMYLNYPGTVTGLNYVSGTQVAIIIEAPYITVGLPCSIDFALAANNVNTSTTPATIPSISSIPTLINVASIDGGNAASFTSYPLTITPYTQCTSTFELIVLTTYKFELSVFNNVGSTQLTSIYCSEGSAATATMSITTAASWLTYTDSSQYFAGVVPSATTSVTATASINIASQNIVISPGITITITGTCADTNCIQCSSASACDLCNTGYKINSTNANQCICQSAIDPSSQQSSPASSSQTNTTTTTTTTATTTFAQLTQDQSSGTTGQATAGATAACLGGVAVSSTIMTTQSSTQLIFTLLGFYQMLLMMLMLNFDFPQLFIDFLKPFKIVNLNLDFMSSIPVINEVKDFFSINGMNSPDISRMQLTKNTFIYNFICAIGFIILVICLHLIVYCIYRKCKASIEVSNCKTKIAEFLKSMFYYGFYIHYLLESFMVMAICSIFTLMNVKNSSAGMIISAVSSCVYLLFIAAFICFVVYRVCKINDEAEVKGKYKALYDKIDYSKRAARHYSILYLVRRIVLVGAIMSLSNSYVQLSIFVLNQLCSIVYLIAVRPFERAVDNINIVIVELGNLICLCFVFMLPTSGSTDYSVSRTKMVGYCMMYSILASTNVPIGITYIGFIASCVKRKKRIAPSCTTAITQNANQPFEEVKTSVKQTKHSGVSNESNISSSNVLNNNQRRYNDNSLTPNSFIFKQNEKEREEN